MVASVTLVAGGVILLAAGFPLLALALALYGAGNGIGRHECLPLSVARSARSAAISARRAARSALLDVSVSGEAASRSTKKEAKLAVM